jgi:hypothetical protein
MIDWITEYIKSEERIKNIVSSDEYVKWIKKFMSNKSKIFDDDYSYYSNRVNNEDKEKLDFLSAFFDGIDHYASDRDIYPCTCESGVYYDVKYKDFFFKIGILIGQGSCCFCERSLFNNKKEYIDFEDIIDAYKKRPVTKERVKNDKTM